MLDECTSSAVEEIKRAVAPAVIDDCVLDRGGASAGAAVMARFLSGTEVSVLHEASGGPVSLLVNGHFDLAVSALVKDGRLGTLGLLHVVPAGDASCIARWCRDRVDEAVHLRHLLLTATRNAQETPRQLAFTVEVVFCTSSEREHVDGKIGTALRSLYREGSFLHAVGINLWQVGGQPVAQGLPWLLTATRAAIRNLWTRDASNRTTLFHVERLQLKNFRIAGERRLDLSGDARVHVVHGPNGSGKSSIVEALELLCTGKIARLESGTNPNYVRILRNRHVRDGDAEVVACTAEANAVRPVTPIGIAEPLAGALKGDSIRLNQELADRLAAGSSGQRAATFLGAFFSERIAVLDTRRSAIAAFHAAWAAVPVWARGEASDEKASPADDGLPPSDAETVVRRLGWLTEAIDSQRVTQLTLRGWGLASVPTWNRVPMVVQRLAETGKFSFEQTLKRSAEFDTWMATARTEAETIAKVLTPAIRTLEALQSHVTQTDGARSEESLPLLFDRWLRATAEADLAARLRDVAEVVRVLGTSTPHAPGPREHAPQVFSAQLDGMLQALTRECDEAAWRNCNDRATFLRALADELGVRLAGSIVEQPLHRATAAPATLSLQKSDFEALDQAAWHGLLGAELTHCQPPFGEAARRAIEQGRPLEVRRNDGTPCPTGAGWAEKPLATLRQEQASVDELRTTSRVESVTRALETLDQLNTAAKRVRDSDATAEQTLIGMLTGHDNGGGELLAALNEIKALLSPAAWAYLPLRARLVLGQEQQLEFDEHDGDASTDPAQRVSITQRLNTAELNITALAFFLVCARRVDNPLRMIILDDPLQNMDEMTVTTVARAIGKLVRLWDVIDEPAVAGDSRKHRWRILLLLHGQDDVERVRVEVPCTFHQLPWLGSVREKDLSGMQPRREETLIGEALQPLDAVISWARDDRPVVSQATATS